MKAWLENGHLVFSICEGCDTNAPENAIDVLPEEIDRIIVVNNNIIILDDASYLNKIKENKIQQLSEITKNFIKETYPSWKQISDLIDLEYYKGIINNLYSIDYNLLYNTVCGYLLQAQTQGALNLEDLMNSVLNTVYPNNQLPSDAISSIEQIIKARIRICWVSIIKNMYKHFKNHIESINDINTIKNLSIEEYVNQYPNIPI